MLYYFLTPLKESFSALNLFEYITFRAASAAIAALIISFIVGPWVIHILHKNQIGEEIRPTGPESHMKKRGTPTMGGVIILMAVLLPTLLFAKLNNPMIQIIIIATIWMGIFGFIQTKISSRTLQTMPYLTSFSNSFPEIPKNGILVS